VKKPKPLRGAAPSGGGSAAAAPQPGKGKGRGHGAGKKPAHVPAAVRQARHKAALQAAKTRAKNAKKAKHHPHRKLALAEGVACCSAEALAASLRLSGWPVTDSDVLELYLRTARDLDAGAPILATLEAAAEYGLGGIRPVSWSPADFMPGIMPGLILGLDLPGPHAVLDTGSEWITWGQAWPAAAFPDAVIEEAWEVAWPDTR
jgi:hypothetical protein